MVRPGALLRRTASLGINLRPGNEILSIGADNAVTVRTEKAGKKPSPASTPLSSPWLPPDNALFNELSAALDRSLRRRWRPPQRFGENHDAVHGGFEAALTL